MRQDNKDAEAQYATQYTVAAPLFQMLPLPVIGATASARARSPHDEIGPMANLDSVMPNPDAASAPLPKSWYVIVGEPFKAI
eukprot:158467-Pleurochrysis_carterae.AAC.1